MSDYDLQKKSAKISADLEKLEEKKPDVLKNDRVTGEKVFSEIVAGLIFGTVVGYLIDDYFNTKPLFLISLIILGLAGSIYNIYKATVENDKQ